MTDKTEAQPEALELADRLIGNAEIDECEGCNPVVVDLERAAATELRRQHAEIQQLKAQLNDRGDYFYGFGSSLQVFGSHQSIKALKAQLSARQAAPNGWRLVPAEPTEEMVTAGQESFGVHDCYYAMLSAAPQPPEREPKCWCETCRPNTLSDMRFIVCSDCGNKRCPKATHHDNACTNSNAPGQPGSSWAHVKPHGAPNDNP